MPERIYLDQACREIGLKLPVKVELHKSLDGANGTYIGIVKGSHRIALDIGKHKPPRVGTYVRLPDRSHVLWHELTHALQCERDHNGDSDQHRAHYHASLAEVLGVPSERLSNTYLRRMVQRQFKFHGHSWALDAYLKLPDEIEANTAAEERANVEIIFPVSRKMKR